MNVIFSTNNGSLTLTGDSSKDYDQVALRTSLTETLKNLLNNGFNDCITSVPTLSKDFAEKNNAEVTFVRDVVVFTTKQLVAPPPSYNDYMMSHNGVLPSKEECIELFDGWYSGMTVDLNQEVPFSLPYFTFSQETQQ